MKVSANLYDPKYGAPSKLSEFTREHVAYIEDFMIQTDREAGRKDAWAVVATIAQQYAD